MADWVKSVHDGRCGPRGHSGQGKASTRSTKSTSSTPSTKSTYAEISANGALTLIAVVRPLLDRQLTSQAKAFEAEGGFAERLYRVRSQKRNQP